jgi:hypothetical protein
VSSTCFDLYSLHQMFYCLCICWIKIELSEPHLLCSRLPSADGILALMPISVLFLSRWSTRHLSELCSIRSASFQWRFLKRKAAWISYKSLLDIFGRLILFQFRLHLVNIRFWSLPAHFTVFSVVPPARFCVIAIILSVSLVP